LIEAFRATLEELKYADILVHVVDLSAPHYTEQMTVVYDTLRKLECVDKPIVTAYNKCDVANTGDELPQFDTYAQFSLKISASNGTNIDNLLAGIGKVVQTLRTPLQVCIPYTEGHWVNKIHSTCEVLSIEHVEEGTVVKAYAPAEIAGQLAKFAPPV
jgi:GTP-binding protein HflX